MTIARHVFAILMLPFIVTVVIPSLVICSNGAVNIGWSLTPPLNFAPPLLGIGLIGAGLTLIVKTISLFANVGRGTLAPWDPPQKLVVRGIYRQTRNPMITGVLGVLLGEAMCLGVLGLFVWFAVFLLMNLVYIALIEEPGLQQRFGDAYAEYQRNVPRWIPRREPWEPRSDDE
ncbi:MAG: isoprenylcysteine carboxylmethyltransferase family protein [Chloroflexi bacterium]|nr:isoprenylcysteine carboxylmethyltransferase family protein [Chloroflexota bacterium]